MGWRSKLLFLLVVYFAGFATAIYYLAPAGSENCRNSSFLPAADDSNNNASALIKNGYEKAYAKASESFKNIDKEDLKEKLNLYMQKLIAWAKSSCNSTETAEDK
jgi:hypothetical protein